MNGEKQAGAETILHWFGHASFRLRYKGTVIYIDPWKLPGESQDAALILVSHSHEDHYSPAAIAKASGYRTELLASGDVSWVQEMKNLPRIDIALLPVGGTYTMDAEEAARAVEHLQPDLAIPYHWGDIVGERADAERFARLCGGKAKILDVGETLILD